VRWQLPPLNPLRAFEAAARHSSITLAAEELNVTQSAVSRQIRALEVSMRQPLFVRLHREIRLTAAGEEYFDVVTRLLEQLDTATRRVLSNRERLRIRFMGYHTFNLRWLIPRLADFYARYPHIEIDAHTSVGPVDFNRHEVDCAIRTGRGEWDDCEHRFIAPIEFSPVCRPPRPNEYALQSVVDLSRRTLIRSSTRSEVWTRWLRQVGYPELEPTAWLTFDHGGYCYQAAVEGVGIAIGERVFVADDIKAGRLIYPFKNVYRDPLSYYFLKPRWIEKPGVAEFGSWIAEQASASMAS
jgi:LysR family glycine cleavage system transcriptional activator